ncbi:hypothetical protein NC653_021104 [Populus alba x Populus x berolinensis]|uniref:Uncharacterized protein n=1 Tax=Populus alba x Populus x berolinensis TaxID=444605 RepID=A0AAD6QES9_9ROSI|nr:hypothetical protein NC653_021104 [Populus alba x Populus x berolinensis]
MPKWVQKTKRDLIGHVTCGRGMNNTQKADKGSPLPLDLSFWYTQIATWQMHLTININILTVQGGIPFSLVDLFFFSSKSQTFPLKT